VDDRGAVLSSFDSRLDGGFMPELHQLSIASFKHAIKSILCSKQSRNLTFIGAVTF